MEINTNSIKLLKTEDKNA